MDPNPRFWADKPVCVTGGTGFLGWHLVRQLRNLGAQVRVFGLPPVSAELRTKLQPLNPLFGDILDPQAVRQAVADCEVVFHTACNVAIWGPSLKRMHVIHQQGTRHVLQALSPGARLVHTSSVVAVGATRDGSVLDEASTFNLARLNVDYVHAKRSAEALALSAVERGLQVVVVNPGYLVGPDDYERSIMGRFCLRCWQGRIPIIPPGGFNLADVRDVARGHLLAAEQGRSGQRYILGGENRTLAEFMYLLADMAGLSSRWWLRMPWWLLAGFARLAEGRAWWLNKEPYPGIQQVRVNRFTWFYRSHKAENELGYRGRPLRESLTDAFDWFCGQGWLQRKGKGKITRCKSSPVRWADRTMEMLLTRYRTTS